jgi:DNA-binding NarL/FixJ family response regulator
MRSFWQQTGVLGRIYQLVGEGLNDQGIALQLGLTEVKVRGCITWIVHFFELKSRQDLVRYASTAV